MFKKVFVRQDKISLFGKSYLVSQNKKKLYVIQRQWLTIPPKFTIAQYISGKKIGEVNCKFFSFRANAEISISGERYKFEQESVSSMKYDCRKTTDPFNEYRLIGNQGFGGSIFLDKKQIGQWSKNQFVVFDGDVYELDLDFDANIPLIASMIVLMDNYRISVKIGGDLGWEVGSLGKGLKPKKTDWKPKEKVEM